MSTCSAIAIQQNKEGPIKYVYCHYDGYISHNGKILNEHYRDPVKVKELISLGDIRSLKETVDTSDFFEDEGVTREEVNLKELATEDVFDYRYLLKQDDDGSWSWYLVDYLYGAVECKLLKDVLN